jgi:hypothetical protein
VFKLNDPKWAKRLAEFKQSDPNDLANEIALTRLLVEISVNEGHVGLAGQLLHVVAKMELIQVAQQQRLGNLLDRHALQAAGRAICEGIRSRLSGMPNYELLIDQILPAVVEGVETAGREQHVPVPLLTHEKGDQP